MPKYTHPHISEERLKSLPTEPGVYIMKDKDDTVIYVGKAKTLRTRIRSYFNFSDGRASVQFILKKLVSLETIIVENERQALILESNLISKFRPRYNIRLKDDKSHFLVRVDKNHEWPRLELVRFQKKDGAKYFGPYAFSYELRNTLDIVNKTIPLRTCSDQVFSNRVRPCLEYQIKRCLAPCSLEVSKEKYDNLLNQAIKVLKGKGPEIIEELEKEMELASEQLRFEDAALIRDRINLFKKSQEEKALQSYASEQSDVFGFYRNESLAHVVVMKVRNGVFGQPENYQLKNLVFSDDEVLSSFLTRYYEKTKPPKEIILPFELDEFSAWLELYSENKVILLLPQKGSKKRLQALAQTNAEEAFKVTGEGETLNEASLEELREKLSLTEMPRTIECVDISHFQGGATVGSVVFFRDGAADKERYRRFNLSEHSKPDDFACMKEVLKRHLSRCVEENTLADLIVIDGGKGQLSAALEARKEISGNYPEMIALAKERKKFRAPGTLEKTLSRASTTSSPEGFADSPFIKPERVFLEKDFEVQRVPVILPRTSKALKLLVSLRDEAHRFAITFHRKLRQSRQFVSVFDKVPGIGPKRKMAILREFGSVEELKKHSSLEIAERSGINEKLAEQLLNQLNAKTD